MPSTISSPPPVKEEERASWVAELMSIVDQASSGRGGRTGGASGLEAHHGADAWNLHGARSPDPHATRPADSGPYRADIVGAEGRSDLCVMPSYDPAPLIKGDHGWSSGHPNRSRRPILERSRFRAVAKQLTVHGFSLDQVECKHNI